MKKTFCILLALALLTAGSFPAFAGGRGGGRGHGGYYGHGGNGVGGFFAGLVGGAILGTIISNSYSAPVYAAPPAAYAPPDPVWVPGHYVSRVERQWVPGYWTVERYSRDGYDDDDRYVDSRRVWVPGHYENVRVQVYIPGHWEERG